MVIDFRKAIAKHHHLTIVEEAEERVSSIEFLGGDDLT